MESLFFSDLILLFSSIDIDHRSACKRIHYSFNHIQSQQRAIVAFPKTSSSENDFDLDILHYSPYPELTWRQLGSPRASSIISRVAARGPQTRSISKISSTGGKGRRKAQGISSDLGLVRTISLIQLTPRAAMQTSTENSSPIYPSTVYLGFRTHEPG